MRSSVAPHDGSAAATWSHDPEAGTITIDGVGAFLGIPKAITGAELGADSEVLLLGLIPLIFYMKM